MCIRLALCLGLLAILGCNNSSGDDSSGDDSSGDDSSGDDSPETPDAPPAACANLVGTWATTGSCGADMCTITQSGCTIVNIDCLNTFEGTGGSVSGNTFMYNGHTPSGVPGSCSGTKSGETISGTCTIAGATCSFSGIRE